MKLANLCSKHPWNLILHQQDLENSDTFETLKQLHISGEIQTGDKISSYSKILPNILEQLAKLFPGEYQFNEHTLSNQTVCQQILRVSPPVTSNVFEELPISRKQLDKELSEHGYALFRTEHPFDENQIAELIGGKNNLINYKHGLNARNRISHSFFSYVTSWSQKEEILPHNELSHHTEFPKYVCFMCKQPAQHGGETTIYDCEQAFKNLSSTCQQEIRGRNVVFVRKHVEQRDHEEYDSSWQDISARSSQDAIAHWENLGYTCLLYQEDYKGTPINVLETQLERPFVYHYQGRTCLNASVVGAAAYWYRQVMGDKKPQISLQWSDRKPLPEKLLHEMEEAVKLARIFYFDRWRENDLLILDNLRVAHGRLPFLGDRLVGILMGTKARFKSQANEWIAEEIYS